MADRTPRRRVFGSGQIFWPPFFFFFLSVSRTRSSSFLSPPSGEWFVLRHLDCKDSCIAVKEKLQEKMSMHDKTWVWVIRDARRRFAVRMWSSQESQVSRSSASFQSRSLCRELCGDWSIWCCSALCPKVCRYVSLLSFVVLTGCIWEITPLYIWSQ